MTSTRSRYHDAMYMWEEKVLRKALFEHGSIANAAKALGIHRNTLSRKLTKFGVTEAELIEYSKRHNKHRFGRGWSGKNGKRTKM